MTAEEEGHQPEGADHRGAATSRAAPFRPPQGFKDQALITQAGHLRRGRTGLAGVLGRPGRRAARLVRGVAHHRASGSCPSPSGSSAASSTSPTTASTATSPPAGATRSPSTGRASRATPARSPTPTCSAEVQQFANVLKWPRRGAGRPGGHLHADDPRAAGRHAGLHPHRRGPLGRVRRLLRRRPARPHQRRRGQGPGHRRRRLAPGDGRRRSSRRRRGRGRHARRSPRGRRPPHRRPTSP